MKYSLRFIPFFFLLLIQLFSSRYALASDQQWQTFVNDYNKYLTRKLTSKGIPGGSLAIVKLGEEDFIKGIGRTKIKDGRRVNQHTRFRLASVSKTFAGSLTAKLAAQGEFNIDDPISKFIPEFSNTVYKDDLKIYHILSHSSGLVPNAYDNLIESRMSYPDIVERLLAVEPICKPSECYGYQNVMFSLIDSVILKSTQMDYSHWITEYIFAPLKMNDASVGFEGMVKDENYAHPHVRGRKRWYTSRLKKNYYKVPAAAGVNASASDMAIWLNAQLGQFPDVLPLDALIKQTRPYTHTKKETRRRVWREHVNDAFYGLGWRIYDYDDEVLYYHSGWVQGYRSDLVVFPHLNIGFSLVLNAETGLINELTTEFINRVLKYTRAEK
ncbi:MULTISPECIES: serine hydrolase domain-containing protein [unclassified Pseudoalteromonas]|jgi:beta-lactamase class C|uniref:serine hydrolase domain-containing protein n=1 Tax=unclassified Pseudoalteromonas TaxID=194690 RepID=UPI000C4DC50C|nr:MULTISPECIES: serine hydrolase domain-containing protein [unclassified Pseudoalteromonas]MBU76826.1 serine hydrolase [Pseudoalteromonadaceae bacterium]MCF2902025.1 beta-lactamase family protein [Pseudoalteromonas sp. OFAV1]MCO7248294.1 beta-lactamase family protein [Pseudoalteromonas sp. Ps84H-4]TMO46268.1 serine hydrolase [Pseudoalteromonas sp. S4389]|tara:strand:- start:382 stop:1533 length:1152 start_codon:yes stop_codon:yes gene_type:complete